MLIRPRPVKCDKASKQVVTMHLSPWRELLDVRHTEMVGFLFSKENRTFTTLFIKPAGNFQGHSTVATMPEAKICCRLLAHIYSYPYFGSNP